MADMTIGGLGTKAAPLDYKIPKSLEVLPRSIKATFDGTGAGGSFLPTLQVIADSGDVVGSYPVDTAVVAGASADVSWFPRLRRLSVSSGLGVCGETDVALANPGIYLAAAHNVDTLLTIPANTRATETITATHAVANGDYVVALVGIGSVSRLGAPAGDKFNLDYVPWDNGSGFTPNPAQNPSVDIGNVGISGPDAGYYTGGAGGTNIIAYSSAPVASNALVNIGDTFRFDIVTSTTPATDTLVGPRCYAVVGIPAAALGGTPLGVPSLSGGSSSSNGGAEGFEYLIPSGSYAPNTPQDMAHIYCVAVAAFAPSSDPLNFAGVRSVRLATRNVGNGADPQPDPTTFVFDVALRMHRRSYAGACFRILVPPVASPPFMQRWAAAGTTVQMATSS